MIHLCTFTTLMLLQNNISQKILFIAARTIQFPGFVFKVCIDLIVAIVTSSIYFDVQKFPYLFENIYISNHHYRPAGSHWARTFGRCKPRPTERSSNCWSASSPTRTFSARQGTINVLLFVVSLFYHFCRKLDWSASSPLCRLTRGTMFWVLYVLNGSLLLIGIFANKGLFCKARGKLWGWHLHHQGSWLSARQGTGKMFRGLYSYSASS